MRDACSLTAQARRGGTDMRPTTMPTISGRTVDQSARMRVADHTRFDALVCALHSLGEATEIGESLVVLCRLAVPAHADLCSLDVAIDERRYLQAIGVKRGGDAGDALARMYAADERVPDVVREVTRAGHARTIEAPDPELLRRYARDPEMEAVIVDQPCRALVVVPLGDHRRPLGAATLGFSGNVPPQLDAATEDLLRLVVVIVAHVARAARALELAHDVEQRAHDMLALVSHELKTPLGAARAAAALLHRTGSLPIAPRRLAALSNTVLAAVERMSRLVSDLQELARAKDADLTIDLAPHDVAQLVDEVVETMTPLATTKGVVLHASCPSMAVICDRDRIVQVLCNLVGNSIKFNHAGGHVYLDAARRGGRVRLAVRDDGPGIPRESLTRVFERSWQGSSNRAKGLGLGLYIASRLVRAHGSELQVDSDVGHGSIFCFELDTVADPKTFAR
jgi:signal transduction histidine kinase